MIAARSLPAAAGAVLLAVLAACGDTTEPGTGAVASVSINPPGPVTLEVGAQLGVSVTLRDADGFVLMDRPVTITSSAPSVVKFQSGLLEAVSIGDAMLTARSEGVADTLAITVVAPAIATISVAPVRADLWPAEKQPLVAVARDSRQQVLPNRPVTWSTSNPAVALVDATGLVTAVAMGTAEITASAEGVTETADIVVRSPVTYTAMHLGRDHSCAITTAQVAYCWGRGEVGQLGNGEVGDQDVPIRVSGNFLWQDVAGAVEFGCGAATTNVAYCWGSDLRHRLGNDTVNNVCGGTPCRAEPARRVIGGYNFTRVAAGEQHGCGLTPGGTMACWGSNASSQLGNDTLFIPAQCGEALSAVECMETPVPVRSPETFTALTAGAFHTCALNTAGAAFCWGSGGSGRLGQGSGSSSEAPVAVTGGHAFAAISAGVAHTCAVTTGGTAYCWGAGGSGQIGDGATANRTAPTAVSTGLSFTAIAAGGSHSCGVATDGTAWCWGDGRSGQLGTGGVPGPQTTPVQVAGGLTFATIAAGEDHTCGRTTGGVVYCWGDNSRGQLGAGRPDAALPSPTRVLGQN